MKTANTTLLLTLLLLICYDVLFWNQSPGVNLPVFFLLIFSAFLLLFPYLKKNPLAIGLLSGCMIAGVLVSFNNSDLSILTAIILIFTTVGFVHQVSLRSAPFGLSYFALQFFSIPKVFWNAITRITGHSPRAEKVLKYHSLIYFPVFITILFLIIYSIGDPQFANAFESIVNCVLDFIQRITQFFSIGHLVFILVGLVLIVVAMVPTRPSLVAEIELRQSDWLKRERKRSKRRAALFPPNADITGPSYFSLRSMLSLKNEYRRGIITLVLINLLLLFVNSIDISQVWFNGQHDILDTSAGKSSAALRSDAVHSSTDALIFSIFLAMAVLLFFFRGNINFLKKNKLIRQLAYVWIVQNFILGITVAIRNWYYIDDFGLTMKRVGVFAFLIATTVGLLTFYFKIKQKKSTFYLIRVNSWAVAGIFLLLSAIDWDPVIAKYNIAHLPPDKLDKQFLLWLDDHALPVLIEHKELFSNNKESHQEDQLRWRTQSFIDRYEKRTWPSWNYADYRVYHYLITQQKIEWRTLLESSTG